MFKKRWIHVGYTMLRHAIDTDTSNCFYFKDINDLNNFNYNKDDIFVFDYMIKSKDYDIIKRILDKNVKFVNDILWDVYTDDTRNFTKFLLPYQENGIVFRGHPKCNVIKTDGWNENKSYFVPMWFWYAEYFESKRRNVNFCANKLSKTDNKKFFMAIGNFPYHKKLFVDAISNQLDDAIYSIRDLNKFLPGDKTDFDGSDHDRNFDLRYLNPKWYTDTKFSVVVETHGQKTVPNITEKILKPIQYGHPFISFGSKGNLKLLRENGFLTFDCIFNEAYDEIDNMIERINFIADEIVKFNLSLDNVDTIINHNWQLFHNNDIVQYRVYNEITKHLLELDNG